MRRLLKITTIDFKGLIMVISNQQFNNISSLTLEVSLRYGEKSYANKNGLLIGTYLRRSSLERVLGFLRNQEVAFRETFFVWQNLALQKKLK